jgi:hypothetical protein
MEKQLEEYEATVSALQSELQLCEAGSAEYDEMATILDTLTGEMAALQKKTEKRNAGESEGALVDISELWLTAFDVAGRPLVRMLQHPPRLQPGAMCRIATERVPLWPTPHRSGPQRRGPQVGSYPIATFQYSSTTLYQFSYHVQ